MYYGEGLGGLGHLVGVQTAPGWRLTSSSSKMHLVGLGQGAGSQIPDPEAETWL